MDSSIIDRRKERRVYVQFPATVCWKDVTDEEVVEQSHLISISNSGASFTSSKLIPVGQEVRVTIDVGGPSGTSRAVVIWTCPENNLFKVGVSFRL